MAPHDIVALHCHSMFGFVIFRLSEPMGLAKAKLPGGLQKSFCLRILGHLDLGADDKYENDKDFVELLQQL